MSRSNQRIVILIISVILSLILWAIAFGTDSGLEATIDALIWTGQLAFTAFLIPFFASPLRSLLKNDFTATLYRWRRNSGIAYGGIQAVHLLIIIWLFMISAEQPVDSAMLVIGGLGIALVMVMLVTSFDGPTKAIGRKNWKIIHKSGFYVCSFIYFYDFVVEPILLGTMADYALLASITLAAMILRTIVMLRVMLKPKHTRKTAAA